MSIEESLKLAKLCLTQGKLIQALDKCKQILAQQPNCAKAYLIMGEVWETQGNIQQSMFAFTKALEIEPELPETHAYLAHLYSQQKWFEEAISQYEKAIKLGIKWPQVYYNLGHILYQSGDLDKAIHLYQQAIDLNPNYINAYFGLGIIFNLQGNYQLAINIYKKIIKLSPDFVEAYNNLGCILAQINLIDEAISVYQQGISIQPDAANLYNNLGHALFQKNPETAIATYNRAIKLDPNLALAHYNLGKALQSINHHELAIKSFQTVIEQEPDNILAYSDCGFSLMTIGRVEEAMICFQKVVVNDLFVNTYCQLVETRLVPYINQNTDELDLAKIACVKFLRKLQKLDIQVIGDSQNHPQVLSINKSQKDSKYNHINNHKYTQELGEIYVYLGNVSMKDGSYEAAEQYYQKALQYYPCDAESYYKIGQSLAKQQKLNAAIVVYKIALEIVENQINRGLAARLYFELGKIQEIQSNWKSAIDYYSKVVLLKSELDGKDENIYLSQTARENSLTVIHKGELVENLEGLYYYTKDWILKTDKNLNNYLEIFFTESEENKQIKQKLIAEEKEKYLKITPTYKNQRPECNGLNCAKCLWEIYQLFEPKYLGQGIYISTNKKENNQISTFSQLQKATQNPTFVATISSGKAWIMPRKSYWQLCHAIAIMTPDNYLLADISREYPSPLPRCDKHDQSKHQVFLEELPPLEKIDGKVAILSSLSGNIYFHWIVDLLPRIEILRRGVNLTEIDWFVVNNNQQKFQQETLKTIGIPENKILASDRHPYIQAKHLVVPSFPSYLGWLQPWGLKFLRQVFLTAKILSKSSYPERIYVSRDNARYRRVLNEAEVRETLEKVGFVTVTPESMSWENQIATFAHAKIILAPHGSGLTNIVFCNSETKVIELFSPHYIRYYYWQISQLLGLEHYYLIGEAFSCYPIRQLMYESSLTEDILVNLGSLNQILKVLGIQN
ncbi:MAG: tetratricopeptide repeat protein [Microcoleaceae cyanobacterium MO_207.B10]|nr:tetratricopeptide repeat protein [Microcoleaceae cyanobacterium MO_207.B10]